MRPTNERRRYNVTSSLIGWTLSQINPEFWHRLVCWEMVEVRQMYVCGNGVSNIYCIDWPVSSVAKNKRLIMNCFWHWTCLLKFQFNSFSTWAGSENVSGYPIVKEGQSVVVWELSPNSAVISWGFWTYFFIGEFPAQRPVTRSFDVFFDLRLNKPLSKQWWGWWFETLWGPLWRHCNAVFVTLDSALYFASVSAVLYELSCYIGRHYDGTQLYIDTTWYDMYC